MIGWTVDCPTAASSSVGQLVRFFLIVKLLEGVWRGGGGGGGVGFWEMVRVV